MKPLTRSTIAAAALTGLLAGTASPASAIVGGHDATHPYPGVASMRIVFPEGTALCGGSLIAPRGVLTAAHCVSDEDAAPAPKPMPGTTVTVRVASLDRTSGGQVATGTTVYLHPDWAWGSTWPATPVSDLALVELDHPVRAPLTPLTRHPVRNQSRLRLVGWGLTQYRPRRTPPHQPPCTNATPPGWRIPDARTDSSATGKCASAAAPASVTPAAPPSPTPRTPTGPPGPKPA